MVHQAVALSIKKVNRIERKVLNLIENYKILHHHENTHTYDHCADL